MSQEKVDKRKADKANREKHVKREKFKKILLKVIPVLILAAIVFWLSFSGYNKYKESKGRATVTADFSDLSEYSNGLSENADAE